jgi:predicted GTPase
MSTPEIPGYDDLQEIGRGGFAAVYRARQISFNRIVALKVLLHSGGEEGARQLAAECQAVGGLSWHPNVVSVHDAGVSPSGMPYLAMEYLEGGTVVDRMRREGALAWPDVVTIGAQIAGALETAHRAGILHRDVKPENVLVDSFGDHQLADFGIALHEDAARTTTGAVTASVLHASPEILYGKRASARSDLYALASSLHMLLTGRPAFLEPTDETALPAMMRIATQPVPDLRPRGVPDDLATAIELGMAKEPDGRPATAREFGELLQSVQRAHGLPVTDMRLRGDARPAAVPTTAAPVAVAPVAPATSVLPTLPPMETVHDRSPEVAAVASAPLPTLDVASDIGLVSDAEPPADDGVPDDLDVATTGVVPTLDIADPTGFVTALDGPGGAAAAPVAGLAKAEPPAPAVVDAPASSAQPAAAQSPAAPALAKVDADEAEPAPAGREPSRVSNQLVRAVLTHANSLHSFTKGLGRDDLAKRLESEAKRWKEASTNVVVAGDIKRGKSSFINALIGHPGLLPVDADVATSIYLVVRHAEQPEAIIWRKPSDEEPPEPISVSLGELPRYASMMGEPELRRSVTRVEVGLPLPLLERGLSLIDTPGVGGMSIGHRDVTLSSLGVADALLFALSSQEPVLRTELDFLAEAVDRIETVVFVLTKVDANAEWPRLLEEDRAKIAAYAGQLDVEATASSDERLRERARRFRRLLDAPVLPVSARLADVAAERAAAGRDAAAADFRHRSGLDAVEGWLDASVRSRENLRLSNILQLALSTLAALESAERDRVAGADGDPDLPGRLKDEQEQAERFAAQQAQWRVRFNLEVQRLQQEVGLRVGRQMSELEASYRRWIQESGTPAGEILQVLANDLERSLQAAWINLGQALESDLERIVEKLVEEFQVPGMELVVEDLAVPDRIKEIAQRTDSGGSSVQGFDFLNDGLPTLTGAWVLAGIMGAVVAWPVGLALGAAVSGANVLRRVGRQKDLKGKAEAMGVVQRALGQTRQEFQAQLVQQVLTAKLNVELAMDERIQARRREIEVRRNELKQLASQDAASRKEARAAAQARLTEAAKLRKEAERLRDKVYEALKV